MRNEATSSVYASINLLESASTFQQISSSHQSHSAPSIKHPDWTSGMLSDVFNVHLTPHLSGRDACAVRSVCRSWKRIKYLPECIYVTKRSIRQLLASHLRGRAVRLNLDAEFADTSIAELVLDTLWCMGKMNDLHVDGIILSPSAVDELSKRLRENYNLTALSLSVCNDEVSYFEPVFLALFQNTSLTRLDLEGRDYGFALDAPADALHFLSVNQSLRTFNIKHLTCAKLLADALKVNTSLQSLALVDPQITDDQVRYFFDAVSSNGGLTRLEFHLDQGGYPGIRSGLWSLHQQNTTLTSLDLTFGRSNDDIIHGMVSLNENVRSFRLETNGHEFGCISGKKVVKQLHYAPDMLQKLYLENLYLGEEACSALSELVSNTTCLAVLSLRDCDVSFYGDCFGKVASFDASLCKNTTITELDLTRNSSSNYSLQLAEVLQVNTTLTRLNLSQNNADESTASALSQGLRRNSTLKELILAKNRLGDKGMVALSEGIKENVGILILDLTRNQIGDSGAHALANALKVNTMLFNVDLEYNGITDGGIVELLQDISNLFIRPMILKVAHQRAPDRHVSYGHEEEDSMIEYSDEESESIYDSDEEY